MKKIIEVLKQYYFYDKNIEYEKFGNGNINKTYLIKKGKWYILQQINDNVFKNPNDVIYNINLLNEYSKERNLDIEIINLIKNLTGEYITKTTGYKDSYFRCYNYIKSPYHIEDEFTLNMIYEGGKIIGKFLKEFNELDYRKLKVIIPDFHNTKKRYNDFIETMTKDKYFRKKLSLIEIGELVKNKDIFNEIFEHIENNQIRLRVCHNDTKLSNIIFDNNGKAKALIDMDTIMPGYLIFDYADGIRSCISNLKEDDFNYNDLKLNFDNFKEFSKGFLEEVKDIITEIELNLLVNAIEVITYECALRFLTDFLNNDQYFKTTYCSHNLIRTRNQLMLLKKLKENEEYLKNTINNLYLEIKIK